MLQITFATADTAIAERMQSELPQYPLRLERPTLLVLVSPTSVQDEAVLKRIKQAQKDNNLIVPIIIDAAPLPAPIADLKALDISGKYDVKRVAQFIKRADIGDTVLQRNQRLFWVVGIPALAVFLIAIWSLATGVVAPPNDEYATENALIDSQIQTVIFPVLDESMPRTTEDAVNFPLTVEAVNTRYMRFIVETATALPINAQATVDTRATAIQATDAARATATQAASEQ